MKIAVHIGGKRASSMLARQLRNGPVPEAVHFDFGTIAVAGSTLQESNGDLFVTVGTPLDVPNTLPSDIGSATHLLKRQNGAFASIYWSAAEKKLLIVTDFLGFKPLYLRRVRGELQIASDTKAWSEEPDLSAWGAFVSFGHVIGDRSLMAGIERVRPATVLVYDPVEDKLTENSYWTWPTTNPKPDLDALVESLRDSIRAYREYGAGQLLLSGGFDSRLIAFLLRDTETPVSATCVSHHDELLDADGKIASALARQLRIPLTKFDSPTDFFSSAAYLDYVFDSDAATSSLYLFISQVSQFLGDKPVWEGLIPGPTLKTAHQPSGGFVPYLRRECKAADSEAWNNVFTVFRKETAEGMRTGFEAHLRHALEAYPDTEHGVSEFIIRNRVRNRTGINPLKVYETRTRAFLPGMTRNYFEIAASIPFHTRTGNNLYLELFRRYFPDALKLPIVSGGTLTRTSPWSVTYYWNRILGGLVGSAASYPTVCRKLGFDPLRRSSAASALLSIDRLIDESDSHVDQDEIHRLHRAGQLSESAQKLLFHWQAWRHVHSDGYRTQSSSLGDSRADESVAEPVLAEKADQSTAGRLPN